MSKPILCVDFDGVLHAYSKGWHDGTIYDGPVPGAMVFLADAVRQFDVQIFSSRSRELDGCLAMISALDVWLTDEFGRAEGRAIWRRLGFPTFKPSAFVTLDDRAVTFTGTFPSIETLRAFKPWTQRRDGPA